MVEVDLGMAVLRIATGLTFAYHGYNKAKSLDGTAGWFESMGMRPGRIHARLAAFTELGAGLMLAAGLLTPFASLAIVGVMVVAGYTVHRNAFLVTKDGFEFTFLIAVIAISVATVGPGAWSIDNAIGFDLNGWGGFLVSAVGGVAAAAAQLGLFYRPPAPDGA